jgi:hypothetical protein
MFRLLPVLSLLFFTIPFAYAQEEDGTFYSNVVAIAKESIGLEEIPSIGGKYFRSDCIGFVKFVYKKAGLDLDRIARMGGNNGVAIIYYGLLDRQFVYTNRDPVPGDLVFFDNTYDYNGNGKWDDPLTHVGIVTERLPHNTWAWIHYASGEVKEYRINLSWPETHAFRRTDGSLMIINSYLRRDRGEGYAPKEYVASSFFRAFAHVRVRYQTEIPATARAGS